MTAIDYDLNLNNARRKVPDDRAKLLEWVKNPDNLDAVARAVRRQMSVYVSTGRLFAIQHGPIKMDWPAVADMITHAEDVLKGAAAFLNIGTAGPFDDSIQSIRDAVALLEDARGGLNSLLAFDLRSCEDLRGSRRYPALTT